MNLTSILEWATYVKVCPEDAGFLSRFPASDDLSIDGLEVRRNDRLHRLAGEAAFFFLLTDK